MRKYPYVVTARLSAEGQREYEKLLERFGKAPWASKSENFRELVHRLSAALCMETKWDNEPWISEED